MKRNAEIRVTSLCSQPEVVLINKINIFVLFTLMLRGKLKYIVPNLHRLSTRRGLYKRNIVQA